MTYFRNAPNSGQIFDARFWYSSTLELYNAFRYPGIEQLEPDSCLA